MNFKLKIVISVFCFVFLIPMELIRGSFFSSYTIGVFVLYFNYLLLFSNRTFISNQMFVQRFPSKTKLYRWYIKNEFKTSVFYIICVDFVLILIDSLLFRIVQIGGTPAINQDSIKWIAVFSVLNVAALVSLRFISLLMQLLFRSFWSTAFLCAYIGWSGLSAFVSILYIKMDFSIISPAFKQQFFRMDYLILSYMIILILMIVLYRKTKRTDLRL